MKFSKEVTKFAQSCKRWANRNSHMPEKARLFPTPDGGWLVRVPMLYEKDVGFFFNGKDTVTKFDRCPSLKDRETRRKSGQIMDLATFDLVYGR